MSNPLFPITLNNNQLSVYCENPPSIVDDDIYVSTGWLYKSDYPENNLITNTTQFKDTFETNLELVLGGDIYVDDGYISRNSENSNILSQSEYDNSSFWKTSYYGCWDIDKKDNGDVIYITVGEHKNILHNSICYQGRIHPETLCSECKFEPGVGDCNTSYSAFIGQATLSSNGQIVDNGPILWPPDGYTEFVTTSADGAGGPGWGIRHPESIIHGDYLYVYYQDFSYGSHAEGRGPGIKLARSPLSSDNGPGTFQNYFKDTSGNIHWDNALPPEYSMGFKGLSSIDDYSIKGGRATSLFGDHYLTSQDFFTQPLINNDTMRYVRSNNFAVAKIKGTDYFLGVENAEGWLLGGGGYVYFILFRYSKDLINWDDALVLEDTIKSDSRDMKIFHVKFLNKSATTTKEIDLDNFYIMGTHNPDGANGRNLYIKNIGLKLPANN